MPKYTPHLSASFTRPSEAVAFAAGDHIGNSLTAGLVTPMSFGTTDGGKIVSARCVVTPASGNVVITALAFDLLLFRGNTNIPFAAAGFPADNTALVITSAAFQELIAVIPFVAAGWRSTAGVVPAVTTVSAWQRVALTVPEQFNLGGIEGGIVGVLQAQGAWTPGAVANLFSFTLGVSE